VLGQQVVIDARLVVEAFQEPGRNQMNQVAVAFGIFAKQDEMIGPALRRICRLRGLPVLAAIRPGRRPARARIAIALFAAIVAARARHVNFAADDRLHAPRGGFVMEMLGGKKIAMIGDGHGRHAPAGRFVYQFRDVTGAVEKTVIGMQVQMDKTRCRHRCVILVAAPPIFQNAPPSFARVFNRRSSAAFSQHLHSVGAKTNDCHPERVCRSGDRGSEGSAFSFDSRSLTANEMRSRFRQPDRFVRNRVEVVMKPMPFLTVFTLFVFGSAVPVASLQAQSPKSTPLILEKDQGERRVWRPVEGEQPEPSLFILKVDPRNGGSSHLVFGTEDMEPGGLIETHRHPGSDEILFLQNGTAKVTLGDMTREVHGGSTVFIPSGTWISVVNTGKEAIHLVFVFSAPGFEEFMRAESVREGEKPVPLKKAEDLAIQARHAHAVIYR
jgi:quercetin dioxygenase-like cupin family protein